MLSTHSPGSNLTTRSDLTTSSLARLTYRSSFDNPIPPLVNPLVPHLSRVSPPGVCCLARTPCKQPEIGSGYIKDDTSVGDEASIYSLTFYIYNNT